SLPCVRLRWRMAAAYSLQRVRIERKEYDASTQTYPAERRWAATTGHVLSARPQHTGSAEYAERPAKRTAVAPTSALSASGAKHVELTRHRSLLLAPCRF